MNHHILDVVQAGSTTLDIHTSATHNNPGRRSGIMARNRRRRDRISNGNFSLGSEGVLEDVLELRLVYHDMLLLQQLTGLWANPPVDEPSEPDTDSDSADSSSNPNHSINPGPITSSSPNKKVVSVVSNSYTDSSLPSISSSTDTITEGSESKGRSEGSENVNNEKRDLDMKCKHVYTYHWNPLRLVCVYLYRVNIV